MPSTRDIRRRIKSVKNTRQITKAMELVAASKMKRAQQAAQAGRPYADLLGRMLAALTHRELPLVHPFLERREVRSRGILLISTDRGLCGPLNANTFKLASDLKREPPPRFVTIGRKGAQFIARTRRELLAEFSLPDRVPFAEVRTIAEFLAEQYTSGAVDTVEVIYPHYVNTLNQQPTLLPLLPIHDLGALVARLHGPSDASTAAAHDEREMIFEPDPTTVLARLLPLYFNREIYQILLSARASEHSARMVAMKTAKDNATKLVGELTLQYNKARQAAITQEILEIAAATFSQ